MVSALLLVWGNDLSCGPTAGPTDLGYRRTGHIEIHDLHADGCILGLAGGWRKAGSNGSFLLLLRPSVLGFGFLDLAT